MSLLDWGVWRKLETEVETDSGNSLAENYSVYDDDGEARPRRADARRNSAALIAAARTVFMESGVDAPAKVIADRAGVGVGTLYRNFPRRSDLVKAVFRQAVDACADAAPALSDAHPPGEALAAWLELFTGFLATKRGFAAALHSGDPAFSELPAYFNARFEPALAALLDAAAAAGEIRPDVAPRDLLYAVARLFSDDDPAFSRRMVALLIDGLGVREPRS